MPETTGNSHRIQNRITVYMRDIEELKNYSKNCEEELDKITKRERYLEGEIYRLKNQPVEQSVSTRSVNSDRVVESHASSNGSRVNPDTLITKINKLEYQ